MKIEIRTATRSSFDITRPTAHGVEFVVGGLVFWTDADSPAHARELVVRVAQDLGFEARCTCEGCVSPVLPCRCHGALTIDAADPAWYRCGPVPPVLEPAACCGCRCGRCRHQGGDGQHVQACTTAILADAIDDLTPWPADRPPQYNGRGEPCDMWTGPCSCGAWHKAGV